MSFALIPRASLIPLDNFLGAWLIGLIVSSVVFGITCLQAYLYFTKYCSRDSALMKTFLTPACEVAILLALDALNLALLSHSFYVAVVNNFGDYVEIGKPPCIKESCAGVQIQTGVGVLLSNLVQLFYGFKIYTISKKSLLVPVMIAICACAEFGIGIAYMNKAFQVKYFKDAKSDIPYSTSALSFEVACDVLITGAMVHHLLRSKNVLPKTNRAINLLVSYIVNSGAATMLFAIGSLVAWVTSTTTLIYGPFFFVLVRIGLIFSLNSRDYVREQMVSSNSSHGMHTIPSFATDDTPVQGRTYRQSQTLTANNSTTVLDSKKESQV
ncbi:hypothetical protein B0H13DRAFT_1892090 [Mycena leptocephala]|nr:hypothetical protein B0H13DRAFT_1892090 [Mycena leptocephala]